MSGEDEADLPDSVENAAINDLGLNYESYETLTQEWPDATNVHQGLSRAAAPSRGAGEGRMPESRYEREGGPPAVSRSGGGRAVGQPEPGRGGPAVPRHPANRLLHGRPSPLRLPRGTRLSRSDVTPGGAGSP